METAQTIISKTSASIVESFYNQFNLKYHRTKEHLDWTTNQAFSNFPHLLSDSSSPFSYAAAGFLGFIPDGNRTERTGDPVNISSNCVPDIFSFLENIRDLRGSEGEQVVYDVALIPFAYPRRSVNDVSSHSLVRFCLGVKSDYWNDSMYSLDSTASRAIKTAVDNRINPFYFCANYPIFQNERFSGYIDESAEFRDFVDKSLCDLKE